ncbi:unnamed protein product [Brassica napus]|nr:unnamed protein product [Brassica napus]
MPSMSCTPSSGFNTVFENTSKDGTPVREDDSLSRKKRLKKSSSTSRLLNKVAAKATSMKEALSASMEGSLNANTSFSNGYSEQILNEDDSSNASLINTLAEFDPFLQTTFYPENEMNTTSDLDIDQDYFSHFLENFGRDDDHNEEHYMNHNYGHDLLMSDVSQEVSSTSVDDQDNTNEGWSNYLLDHADFIHDMDSDSLGKHLI